MYIAEIEINNLRCFRGKHVISLDRGNGEYAGWTVFVGRNGSGKSTLLKAVAAAVAGPLAVRSLMGSVPNWVRVGSKEAKIDLKLAFDPRVDDLDDIVEGSPAVLRTFQAGLHWKRLERGKNAEHGWSFGRLQHKGKARDLAEQGPWQDVPSGWFVAGYGPYRRLGPATTEVVKVSADPKLARLINLFSEGATLSDAVDWLREQHARALEGKPGAKALRDEVLALLNDGLLPDGSSAKKVDSDGLWIRRDGVDIPLTDVSDGYRTVTALVVDLARRLGASYGKLHLTRTQGGLHCPLPGVVLIDEVDAHLHVEWQQKIGLWLTRHFPKLQFLTTSHSPFICQSASAKGIVRLPATGEKKRRIELLAEPLFKAVVNGGADDAVMSELFGLDHAHSARAEALRRTVAQLELKMLRNTAKPAEERRYLTLRAELPDDLGEVADRKLRIVKASGGA
ncbi:MAG: AAA family ATPase [Kofleriaceae bacterium]